MTIEFANVETNLFPSLSQRFQTTGLLKPVELWAILKWKANRSSSRHLERLGKGERFNESAKSIADAVFKAKTDQDRLRFLMQDFGFRLPTATAILTVLYPDRFIIYDFRVCESLGGFYSLKHRRYTALLWTDYERYKACAIARAPAGLTLRQVDHYHWGASWLAHAETDLADDGDQATPITETIN